MQSKRREPNSETPRYAKRLSKPFGYLFNALCGQVIGTKRGLSLGCALLASLALVGLAQAAEAQRAFAFTPSIGVGVTSATQMVPMAVKQAGTVSSIHVLTSGSSGLDYAAGSSSGAGLCSTGTAYSAGKAARCQ